jgi:anti-sigma B factor antagonist
MPAMDEIKLSLSQAGPLGELSVIRVDGVVDTITASELEGVIANLVAQKRFKMLIDLGGVEYISSAGWGIFISRIQEIRDQGGDLKLVNMVPNVYEIYELLEFENIIPAFPSLEQGKKAFNIAPASEGGENRVWKAEDRVVAEPSGGIQAAMAPGNKRKKPANSLPILNGGLTAGAFQSEDDVVLQLVIDDPFSTVSELNELATKIAPQFRFGWWRVLSILRHHKLLRLRSRFRLSRRYDHDR